MRVVVDYPTFLANSVTAQVFYTTASGMFIACYIKNEVTFEIIIPNQPATWATDFLTPIYVISIVE